MGNVEIVNKRWQVSFVMLFKQQYNLLCIVKSNCLDNTVTVSHFLFTKVCISGFVYCCHYDSLRSKLLGDGGEPTPTLGDPESVSRSAKEKLGATKGYTKVKRPNNIQKRIT